MTENLKKFLEAVSQSEEEKKKVITLTEEEVIAYAKGKGFTLTEEDFKLSREELSDDELDAVAGGHDNSIPPLVLFLPYLGTPAN